MRPPVRYAYQAQTGKIPLMATADIAPGQSEALLKALHILTRDGQLNQDSRRKLKQVYHLFQFIEPLLVDLTTTDPAFALVDHGAGKSYLGFILVDLFLKTRAPQASVWGIERREDLVSKAQALADEAGFTQMRFLALDAQSAIAHSALPNPIGMVTALHACDTATDDAIQFGLAHQAQYIVVVPCCQAQVAAALRQAKKPYDPDPIAELWRRPLHTREFGSQLTNTLRCLQLEAHGYQVTVTELIGWEHSLKNELLIAQRKGVPQRQAAQKLKGLLDRVGLPALSARFAVPEFEAQP